MSTIYDAVRSDVEAIDRTAAMRRRLRNRGSVPTCKALRALYRVAFPPRLWKYVWRYA